MTLKLFTSRKLDPEPASAVVQPINAKSATCTFCGCSEVHPCHFSAVVEGIECGYVCSWMVAGICTAPRCVERAYKQACAIAEAALQTSLRYYPEVAERWLNR